MASVPWISVVVPTLRRADTLRHCLRTLMAQDFADCEFVVQNNGGDADVRKVVSEASDPRIKYYETNVILPMTENWETALANARGDLVTFIGDDDGLLPDACSIAAHYMKKHGIKLLSWAPSWYFWPEYYHAGFKNKLLATVDCRFRGEEIFSHSELARVYRYEAAYSVLPMIYNSFVHRDLIERAKAEAGSYFVGRFPDVTSGIINAAMTHTFVRLTRPLSVTGTSQHSTGHNLTYLNRKEIIKRDFVSLADHPSLPDVNHLQIGIARDLLTLHVLLFSESADIELSYRGLMQAVAATINDYAGEYEQLRAAITAIGVLKGVDATSIDVPEQTNGRDFPALGITVLGPVKLGLVMDGDELGLEGIDDAVRHVAQLVPRAERLEAELHTPTLPVLEFGRKIRFAAGSAGTDALVYGWSKPESRGVWSIGTSSAISFRVPQGPAPWSLELGATPFLHDSHPALEVRVSAGLLNVSWHFSIDEVPKPLSLEVPQDAVDETGRLTVFFTFLNPSSPARGGLSIDTRELGLFLMDAVVRHDHTETRKITVWARCCKLYGRAAQLLARFSASE